MIETERHTKIDARYRGQAADALAVTAVLIQTGADERGGIDPGQQAGA